jgi:ABC-2 type transport system permease protein
LLSASIYITFCTARNRMRARLRRLREPRYLIGAIVGAAYLYFAVFARGRRPGVRAGRGRPGDGDGAFPLAFQFAGASLLGLGVFVLAALAWLLPSKSSLLEFSEAERALLFPAPVSRRQLLAHRIIRSQVASLIASVFLALFATPVSGLGRVRIALGFWMLLVTIRVYYAAVTLTRARLQSAIPSVRRVAWVPIGLMIAALAVVGTSVVRQLEQPAAGVTDAMVQLSRVTSAGLPHVVLWPFIAMLRPPFATSSPAFFSALAGSLAVLVCVTTWMLMSDAMFDAVAGEGGGAQAEGRPKAAIAPRVRNVGWTLALEGRVELALFWKGAMETLRGVSVKTWRYALPLLFGIGGITFGIMGANRMRGASATISIVAGIVAAVSVVFGPQIANSDLRTDFEHLDLLKTWPLRAADVIRGEMMWPVLLVSSTMWAGVAVAALFSTTAFPGVPFVSRWSFAIAAACAGPALIAAQFAVHGAMTIFFPAWVQLGTQRTRGIDAMGQRLVMLAAIVVSLAVFALPGGLAGGAIWFLFHALAGDVVYIPAAIVFAVVVLVEVLAVTELLGPAYDRIDLTSVERAE